METFKFSLDKSSKKHLCPKCNKRTFVLYVDTETNEPLPESFGRCDREQKCNYHKAPPKGNRAYLIAFLSLKEISIKAYKLTDSNGIISIVPKSQIFEVFESSCWISEWFLNSSKIIFLGCQSKYFNFDEVEFLNEMNATKEQNPPESKPTFISLELHQNLIDYSILDHFTGFLSDRFSFDEVKNVAQKFYLVGTNHRWEQSTIFWQIDQNENIRGAKIMLYDRATGKRIKDPKPHINWLHSVLKLPDFNLCQCLFGLHQIIDEPLKTVAIVESEKTAIVMSIFLPDYIWVATGSKGNFKHEILKPLKNKTVVAFPDKGEFENWNAKANELKQIGFKISVSNILEKTDFENGFDLADYYLKDVL
jgi:hypothetical protein